MTSQTSILYARNKDTGLPWSEQGSAETIPWSVDTTPWLAAGESPSSVSATLVNIKTGASYAGGLSGSASASGNIITQTITALAADTTYRLSFIFTAASGKIFSILHDLRCPA